MLYKKFKADNRLSDFVLCYYIWEGSLEKPMNIESPPSALCSLVFNLSDRYYISNSKYQKQKVPKTFIAGQAIKNYTLHLQGKIKMLGAVLKPAALFHLFKVPMFNLTGERVDFSILEPNKSECLYSQIQKLEPEEKKIKTIEDYFLERLESNPCASDYIIKAANTIYEEHGQTNLLELIANTPMSRRTFERNFLIEIGLSPKVFAKIRRFGYTCKLMAGKRDVNLMDVLYEGGYYDQSHFIKDFKYFSGRTPRKYTIGNTELANYLDDFSIVEERLHTTT